VTLHLAVRSDTGIDDVNALNGETLIAGGTGIARAIGKP
jgi:hypothetical protein